MHALEKQFGSKMDFEIVMFNKGDAPERIKKYQLQIHGMVIVGADDEVLWKESGHQQSQKEVTAKIESLLGS